MISAHYVIRDGTGCYLPVKNALKSSCMWHVNRQAYFRVIQLWERD